MSLNDLLSQLSMEKRETVYLSVTPTVGLELIQLDMQTKTVKNYAYRSISYNDSLREISNMDAFKDAVVELFEELHINIKSNVVLNLPMVLMGMKSLPVLLADEAVTEALTSEVEQSYIFKRYEPIVSWNDITNNQAGDSRKFLYSAIQKNVIDNIKTVLTGLGITVIGVEISLVSILKALAFSKLTEAQMKDGISWNLMLISSSGYSICSMIGKDIIDYYEEPLAIKSFDDEEIYNAISASAQITLMNYPANYLYIVSETDLVSAELLANRLPSDGIVDYLENNAFKKQDFIPVSLEILEENAHKISLEAIGVAAANSVTLPFEFNFLTGSGGNLDVENPDEPVQIILGTNEFYISPNQARNYTFILALIILIPLFLLFLVMPFVVKKKQALLDELNAKVKKVQDEIEQLEKEQNKFKGFDVDVEIRKVLGNNRAKLMAYTALGESVPKKLWLTYFVAKEDGKIDVKGEASNVEDVYTFYKNMRDFLIDTKLRLYKLELKSKSVDEAVNIDVVNSSDYEFEITNMTTEELNPSEAPKEQTDATSNENEKEIKQNEKNKKNNLVPLKIDELSEE